MAKNKKTKKIASIDQMERGTKLIKLGFDRDGNKLYAFDEKSPYARSVVNSVLSNVLGHYEVRKMGDIYQATTIFRNWEAISERAECSHYQNRPCMVELKALVEADSITFAEELSHKIADGKVEYNDMPQVFVKGSEVVVRVEGQPLGGIIESVSLHKSFFGAFYKVSMKIVHNMTGEPSESIYTCQYPAWAGLAEISALPVQFVSAEQKAELALRGEKWLSIASGNAYVSYEGELVRSSYWSPRSYRSNGRIMVDSKSFRQIDADQFSNERNASDISVRDRDDDNDSESSNIMDLSSEVWRSYPFVYGFSFSSKQWGRFVVANISNINWRENAFNSLVMDEGQKMLVKALVEHQSGTFTDIIEGKGGGTIFLLAGPPGVGKTLTAETVAETLKRPLYTVSVGELGVNPDELERRLRVILDVATVWNAVILLDEADIFLEARDEKDILRNAMVGVFLRLLEYHQGVMFLTTNRVNNIDPAFFSRISIGIEYGAATDIIREKIWANLLSSAGFGSDFDIKALGKHDLNGRQIKNVIRLSQTLAISRSTDVSIDIVMEVIGVTGRFKPKLTHELDTYGMVDHLAESLSPSRGIVKSKSQPIG